MTSLEMTGIAPPVKIMQLMHAGWALQSFHTAVQFDIFSRLSKEPKSASEIAGEIPASETGIELLLNALLSLELLEKKADK